MKKMEGTFVGADGRISGYDLKLTVEQPNDLVVFAHGFMGFKDWGCWNLVQDYFVKNGLSFLKYNVSHNGVTLEQPTDFADLNAFGSNSYSKEKADLRCIITQIKDELGDQIKIHLIGHSRGGGIVILMADEFKVTSVTTWAGISDIGKRFPMGAELENWKQNGSRTILNGRTHQAMPLNYTQYLDFLENQQGLDIEGSCQKLKIPVCAIHGDADTSVELKEGHQIAEWTKTSLHIIPEANHTFGATQPWNSNVLPCQLNDVCDITIQFIHETIQL